ncbi:hypothetical protein E5082_14720 [Streptomyces griseoluteus]|uniref:Uncharacterized protein n=1 Tax=Streptomyces griseoluteus TaxID=29306 RepID=A0A4Z1DJT5_STRGP|nr:hypothetical protein E5082_14720 [Streptomyces griseoluteus]
MRVVAGAKSASMPNRTPVHTCRVNSGPGSRDIRHLIRCISQVKGLCTQSSGHMAHIRAALLGVHSRVSRFMPI